MKCDICKKDNIDSLYGVDNINYCEKCYKKHFIFKVAKCIKITCPFCGYVSDVTDYDVDICLGCNSDIYESDGVYEFRKKLKEKDE